MTEWTNASVRGFAGGRDPIAAMSERVRDLVMEALQGGWQGPPFDPLQLAAHLGIHCVATEMVPDARVVPRTGRIEVEFNPNRPRRRIRFSVAHEIAHTLFPDCAQLARNRGGSHDAHPDGWQLELLCNLAASELLMPTGEGIGPDDSPTAETLVRLQERFDVSIEAVAIRLARDTLFPCTMLVCARVDESDASKGFRVDYSVASRTSSVTLQPGEVVRAQAFGHCTAVGYTSKGTERLEARLPKLELECIGIPPYPGTVLPRVVCIARTASSGSSRSAEIDELYGNALDFRTEGPTIIAHIVNDRTANWGGDFSQALRERYPTAQKQFLQWASSSPLHLRLGRVHLSDLGGGREVASLIAQHGYGPSPIPRLRYAALRDCLAVLSREAGKRRASVQMPRIGTGMAGGNWSFVRQLVDESLIREGVAVTVFTPPGGKRRRGQILGGSTRRLDEAYARPDGA